jgi:TDG/mug DNA glycosylase family protein
MTATKKGLPPVVSSASRVLILGSLPGEISLELQQYYADPSNQFWRILSAVFEREIGATYPQRREFILSHGLALWDVLATAQRQDSLDKNISAAVPNDSCRLLADYPLISTVALNGSTAKRCFRAVCNVAPTVFQHCRVIDELPSASATPGRHVLPLPEKIQRWAAIKTKDPGRSSACRHAGERRCPGAAAAFTPRSIAATCAVTTTGIRRFSTWTVRWGVRSRCSNTCAVGSLGQDGHSVCEPSITGFCVAAELLGRRR